MSAWQMWSRKTERLANLICCIAYTPPYDKLLLVIDVVSSSYANFESTIVASNGTNATSIDPMPMPSANCGRINEVIVFE